MEGKREKGTKEITEAMVALKTEDGKIPNRQSECAIQYDGGYGPTSMCTEEEEMIERFKKQDNMIAAVGLEYLNKTMASQGKSEFELVIAYNTSLCRTIQGIMYHGNFVAKPSDDPNAESHLFFVVCKRFPGRLEAIDCTDLGPVDTDPTRRYRCKECNRLGVIYPTFHPPGSMPEDHSCILCNCCNPALPIFHPSGSNFNHLFTHSSS